MSECGRSSRGTQWRSWPNCSDLGLNAGRIGVETDYLPARDLEQLRSRLPKVRWEAAEGLFDRMRMVKSPREVDLLRRLSRITDAAIGNALGAVRAGDTELDLAAAVTGSLYAGGAEHHKLLIRRNRRT
jgi:Xaa-Pro dipeptidase